MTENEKQLLLKDLCARLPYGFTIHRYSDNRNITFEPNELDEFAHFLEYSEGEDFKPYLRPMSSMTDEEIDRMWEIYESGPAAESSVAVAEYLYERHLDCHYLIEKGLALEAPKDMYKA